MRRIRLSLGFGLLFSLAILLSGCVKLPVKLSKKTPRIPWKMTQFPLRAHEVTKIRLRSRDDISGAIRLYQELIDGRDWGCLDFVGNDATKRQISQCWQGTLVDAAEIRWASGESWAFFAWDTDKNDPHRTLTLFDPRSNELFSCQLRFLKGEDRELTGTVSTCFSWNLSLPQNRKYQDFLDSVKAGYADGQSWNTETRGLGLFRSHKTASTTFELCNDRPLADTYLKKTENE